ncbi:hypothetical protein LK994_01415 [Ferruginibacter lapsinanis]|uniref:hemerythrin domain-containing protein n=1 Tax=Ferruginibacter lapsinanis TaxID=563172 RepID=UPI001E3AC156|nr:hemerythrin domain-containing protein [Ferruginibacter lapsinanis]UEG50133.1 hypothetical protein LK994_01415 [Ferruginibacter lapsinanis]
MIRHKSLVPLSREHHDALLLAQLLKKEVPDYKGMPTQIQEKAAYALALYHSKLKQHFKNEEIMLGKVKDVHEEITKLTDDIFREHQLLTAAFLSLSKPDNTIDELNALGLALDEHIRKEERVLFPMIQQYCSEEILNSFDFNSL